MNIRKYQGGGGLPGGPSVEALLEMLANYDQDSSIGDFLKLLMVPGSEEQTGMSGEQSQMVRDMLQKYDVPGGGAEAPPVYSTGSAEVPGSTLYGSSPVEAGVMGAAGAALGSTGLESIMQNLPPETLEELLRQLRTQQPR